MRIGVLGCGHVSDLYFAGLELHDFLEVVACADLDRARAEAKAAEHGVPRACVPDELLADPEVELVVNLTPPQTHAETTLAAMSAGKHVWSEKPLATTLEDGRTLLTAARDAGVRLGCAPDTWLGGGLQTAIKLVRDGWLGESIAGGVALVTEHGYEHFHPEVHAFYRTGPVLDLGPYYVSALAAMLGRVARVTGLGRATFPERVVGVGPRRGERIPVEVPTHVAGVLEFESGPIVNLLISWEAWRSVLFRSPAGTVATSTCVPAFRSAPTTSGAWSAATVSSVISATFASPTKPSSRSTVCSGERVTTIGYESRRSARPTTSAPAGGSSIASTVRTSSGLSSSTVTGASLCAGHARGHRPIG
jgi:predicted dehydrogenase